MKASVIVRLKSEVLDPEGDAIRGALSRLGFGGVTNVRVGRVFEIEIEGTAKAELEKALSAMADQLLANPVTEDFEIRLS